MSLSRTTIGAVVATVVVGLGGWALAEGELPLVSDSTSDTTVPGTQVSAGGGTDNVAAAVNTHDGKTVVALALKIVQVASETVDPVNAAVAVASCTDCQTVAIALEGVLVVGSPSDFSPTNIALAINTGCSNCQTLAAAYQTVVQNDTRVRISGEGRREIAAIRTELQSLRTSGYDIPTIVTKVNELAARFTTVLQTQVYPIGSPARAQEPSTASSTTVAPPTTVAATTTTTVAETTTTTTTTQPAPTSVP